MPECTCRGGNPNCYKCGGWGWLGDEIGQRRGGLNEIVKIGKLSKSGSHRIDCECSLCKSNKKNTSNGDNKYLLGITYPRTSGVKLKKRNVKLKNWGKNKERHSASNKYTCCQYCGCVLKAKQRSKHEKICKKRRGLNNTSP